MLKRTIKYTDFDDDEISEIFYFNLSKPELLELMVSYKEGLDKALIHMLRTDDKAGLFEFFKKLILKSYGERSEDGKRFIKNPTLAENFSQTEAYNVLYMELLNDDDAAAKFLQGVVPSDWGEELKKEELKRKTAEKIGEVQTTQPKSTAEIAAAQEAL